MHLKFKQDKLSKKQQQSLFMDGSIIISYIR